MKKEAYCPFENLLEDFQNHVKSVERDLDIVKSRHAETNSYERGFLDAAIRLNELYHLGIEFRKEN